MSAPWFVPLLVPFLAPLELLRLSLVSKAFSSMDLSHRTALRSIMLGRFSSVSQQEDAHRRIATIMGQLRLGLIYLPSPLRLLRIALARTCENRLCAGVLKSSGPAFGIVLCAECTERNTCPTFKTKAVTDHLAGDLLYCRQFFSEINICVPLRVRSHAWSTLLSHAS